MTDPSPRIALVGHCRPDVFALTAAIRGFIPKAEVTSVNSIDQLTSDYDLHLVNRILDGSFPSESGIELIRTLPEGSPPAMLITNFPEHAQAAIKSGAVPGFGKANMRSDEAHAALLNALNIESSESHD